MLVQPARVNAAASKHPDQIYALVYLIKVMMGILSLIFSTHMFTSRQGFTNSRKPIYTPKCFSSLNSKPFECHANTLEHDCLVCAPVRKNDTVKEMHRYTADR